VSLTCRRATPGDTTAVLDVHRTAFSTELEAELVSSLLADGDEGARQSWVADADGAVVGHVLLTAGEVPGAPDGTTMLLCPLAVLPSYQHAGVGTAVTTAALTEAAEAGVRSVSVFGDPGYYARFGFGSLLPAGPLPPFDLAEAHRKDWQTLVLDSDPDTLRLLDDIRPVWALALMRPRLWQA
jgi:putative acetyltransferase